MWCTVISVQPVQVSGFLKQKRTKLEAWMVGAFFPTRVTGQMSGHPQSNVPSIFFFLAELFSIAQTFFAT